MDSLTFLEKPPTADEPLPVYVLAGDEGFLRRQVRARLRQQILGDTDDPFAQAVFGEKASFAEVVAAVSTRPFLAPRRLVVVEDADPFVTAYRERVEGYIKKPSTAGVLVLEVKTWTSTTKLARALVENTIQCKAPARAKLPEWCVGWCLAQYGKQLPVAAARALVDLVGEEMGLLDMELSKLAIYVGERARISAEDVDRLVSSTPQEDVWQILSRVAEGDAGGAIRILDGLLATGDSNKEAFRVLGAISWSLTKLAQAGRLAIQGVPLRDALVRVGARGPAESQLRHLGRQRVSLIYDWLLEVNVLLRSTDHAPEQLLLEQLIVKLARKGDAGRVQ
jgi:DNA polymerase-3 subunit delta